MQTRTRKTINVEVSAAQREILDKAFEALPNRFEGGAKVAGINELASLYYHPNGSCRVLALSLSAAFDAVNGRTESAVRKLDRAIEVSKMVDDGSDGSDHLQTTKQNLSVDGDVDAFLDNVQNQLAPYLQSKMVAKTSAPEVVAPTTKPRIIEAGDQLPQESLRPRARAKSSAPDESSSQVLDEESTIEDAAAATLQVDNAPEPEPLDDSEHHLEDDGGLVVPGVIDSDESYVELDEDSTEQEADEAAFELELEVATESLTESEEVFDGVTAAEAAAAAAAAMDAINAPYEEVVEVHSRRFDPDRDAVVAENKRRRSRAPVGLERPRPDQLRKEVVDEQKKAERPEKPSKETSDIVVSYTGSGAEIAEVVLEAAKLALRKARTLSISENVCVEVKVSATNEPRRRRRRRRRRRSSSSE